MRSLVIVVVLFSTAELTAAEIQSTLDLVRADAAVCLEVPQLDKTWSLFEASPLMARVRAFPVYRRLWEHPGFQKWQAVEDHVARQTGQNLSTQLRKLFEKSLVLAVYVPDQGHPQGILIGEATESKAIETILTTWNKLEPNQVITVKTHRDVRYQQRRKNAGASESLYFVTTDRWFAASDQEALIQQVIERMASPKSAAGESLGQSQRFLQNRARLPADAAAYLYLSARPWDRGLEESARDSHDPITPAEIWKHVSAVSAAVQLEQGVVCQAVVELNTSHLPDGWSQFVATAATVPVWNRRVPADALLAVSGHLEIAPVVRFFLSQVKAGENAELAKNRRIFQSLMNGNDLFDVILPALARDFCASVLARPDGRNQSVVLDGTVGFRFDATRDKQLLSDLTNGLQRGLGVLAAHLSGEGQSVITVMGEQSDQWSQHWLSSTAPIPVGYGAKGNSVVIAASPVGLRQALETLEQEAPSARLSDHAARLFPLQNQLIWFDTARTRLLLEQHAADVAKTFAHGSADEAARITEKFQQARHVLALVDSLFVTGRVESDHVRIVFGGGLDSAK